MSTGSEGGETICFVEENLNQGLMKELCGKHLPNEEGLLLLQRLLLLVRTPKGAVTWLKLLRPDTLQLVSKNPVSATDYLDPRKV